MFLATKGREFSNSFCLVVNGGRGLAKIDNPDV